MNNIEYQIVFEFPFSTGSKIWGIVSNCLFQHMFDNMQFSKEYVSIHTHMYYTYMCILWVYYIFFWIQHDCKALHFLKGGDDTQRPMLFNSTAETVEFYWVDPVCKRVTNIYANSNDPFWLVVCNTNFIFP